jgi:phosphoribosylformylglycinamidine synthase
MATKPKALIIRAAGTNCDQETIHALALVGADSHAVHVNQLLNGHVRLHPYSMIVIPGGFSYGDDISAGKVLANEFRLKLRDQLARFVESKKPVIGVCNGFQVLVKSGLLPGFDAVDAEQTVTLALNDSNKFQCLWTTLRHEKSAATWLDGLSTTLELPIAHGEGKFLTASPKILESLKKNKQIVFRYDPVNPNGSEQSIAGVCNKAGNVVGLMPHPERFVSRYQHPNWTNRPTKLGTEFGDGRAFWEKAVAYAKKFTN